MDAQAAPATGARLTKQAVEALIARRLDALGRQPDLLDESAIAALVADAGGSGRRLRSSLAATLFLASTEDAPQIDAGLVHRALAPAPALVVPPPAAAIPAESPLHAVRPVVHEPNQAETNRDSLAAHPPRTGRRWFTRPGFSLAAGGVVLAALLATLVLQPAPQRPAPVMAPATAVQSPAPPPQPSMATKPASAGLPEGSTAETVPAQASPVSPAPAPIAKPATAQPQLTPAGSPPAQPVAPAAETPPPPLPALPPAVTVRSPPVPQADQPSALPALPTTVPASIILLYPARDTGALNRLRPIAERLQHAGMTDIRAKPIHAPSPRRVVSYFYAEDRPLAEAVAKSLTGSAWPKLNGDALQPSLVLPPAGLPGRNPGTIEIQLP